LQIKNMKINTIRLKSAAKAMGWHFTGSLLVAFIVAALVFGVWFPNPYRQLSGGTALFFLIMGIDIVCGPLLTMVLFNPAKPKRELLMDLSLVVVLQLAALAYGIWTVHQVRPLYLVHEVDRFKVIALADVDVAELTKLSEALRPSLFKGPQTIGLRNASKDERETVMFESIQGGRDYGERPSFYATYDSVQGAKAYARARPLDNFVKKHPNKQVELDKLQTQVGSDANLLRYLPVVARQDWVAVLNPKGEIIGYLQGDGF
jgi:hypothetical protein